MKKILTALILSLSALASIPASAAGFNITDVIRASDADLTASIADATSHNDTFAIQCYSGTLAYNQANPKKTLSILNPVGPVSAFQSARDVVKGVQAPGDLVPKEIVSACGPLVLDIQGDVLKAAPVAGSFLGIKF